MRRDSLMVSKPEVKDYNLEPKTGLTERPETIGITYHHTGVSDRPITRHDEFHRNVRGWQMVGYHYQIRSDGTIELGRPHEKQGAHSGGNANQKTIGIAFSGNMNESQPTEQQYQKAIEIHKWLNSIYSKNLLVFSHSDWVSTNCPGENTDLDLIRNSLQEQELGELPEIERKVRGTVLDEEVSDGFLIDGKTYVPLRKVVEQQLGYSVNWDSSLGEFEVTKNSNN